MFEVVEVPEAIGRSLFSMREAVDGDLCLLGVLEVLELPEVIRCMLEAVEVGSVWLR